MKSTLVVFGGGGFIGGNLCTIALRGGWQVLTSSRRQHAAIPAARWRQVDVTDASAVQRLLAEERPEAVVDLAAVADIDRAQSEREAARAVNVEAARVMAQACAELGAAFLYLSSDAVFSGAAGEYREEDPVEPVNYYGETKAEGERPVLAAHPGAAVVRISLALGFPVTDGNSFLAALDGTDRARRQDR
ncbi:sugar nucleotide-binding protein [Candidatus Fermentibacteria bacterium]|nr:sugar nucleotide-binding protein [Candidatus Fermentibacteria bacterium]